MKKLILLLILCAVVFVVWNKQRIYLRDPFAKVTRDGTAESTHVYINYANDTLLQKETVPAYVTLVQHGRPVGMPAVLRCVHFVACLTDADVATLVTAESGAVVEGMDSRNVRFREEKGGEVVVKLW